MVLMPLCMTLTLSEFIEVCLSVLVGDVGVELVAGPSSFEVADSKEKQVEAAFARFAFGMCTRSCQIAVLAWLVMI
jgi:hypothetical protein